MFSDSDDDGGQNVQLTINEHYAKAFQVKKEREARWRAWCEEHRWEPKDDPGYKQKVGSKEVHRSDGEYFPSGCSLRAPRTGNGLLIHAPPVQP